jgi:hypothetical protein
VSEAGVRIQNETCPSARAAQCKPSPLIAFQESNAVANESAACSLVRFWYVLAAHTMALGFRCTNRSTPESRSMLQKVFERNIETICQWDSGPLGGRANSSSINNLRSPLNADKCHER